jgi:hypothetical protein
MLYGRQPVAEQLVFRLEAGLSHFIEERLAELAECEAATQRERELLPWVRHHLAVLAERVHRRRNDEAARKAAAEAKAAPPMSDGELALRLQQQSNIPAGWGNEALAAVARRRG